MYSLVYIFLRNILWAKWFWTEFANIFNLLSAGISGSDTIILTKNGYCINTNSIINKLLLYLTIIIPSMFSFGLIHFIAFPSSLKVQQLTI